LNRALKIHPAIIALVLALGFGVSCRTTDPLPPADLSAPGWNVRQGQVIWKPPGSRPELTGDLLLATNATGNFFLQLTKNPFPLVTAEVFGDAWQIEFGAEEHSWRGRGEPPDRFIWFVLPHALLAEKLPSNWRFENVTTNSWRLMNPKTGETLEGEFFP
jgi:hypothetical protein